MFNHLPNIPPFDTQKFIGSLRKLADELERYNNLGPASVDAVTLISDWAVARRTVPALIGKMTRHPTIQDGNVGLSTEIVFWNLEQGLARSHNRWYRLGSPIVPGPGTHQ